MTLFLGHLSPGPVTLSFLWSVLEALPNGYPGEGILGQTTRNGGNPQGQEENPQGQEEDPQG